MKGEIEGVYSEFKSLIFYISQCITVFITVLC